MNEISTAGISIGYAVESTAGTKPTTGYTDIPNVKSISSVNPAPATYDVTDLSDTEWKRYIPALKDVGGNITLGVNITEAFKTAWETLVSAAETALASDKACWFCIEIPNWSEKFYFAGMPASLGLPEIGTDQAFTGEVYIAPNKIEGWS